MISKPLAYVGRALGGNLSLPISGLKLAGRLIESGRLKRSQAVLPTSPEPVAPCPAFAVIASQRTGTHLLREILNSNPSLAVRVEPFSYGPDRLCWHNFVQTFPRNEYPPPMPADATALFDKFLQAIKQDIQVDHDCYGGAKPELKLVGLDIKYEHIKCISPLYMDLRARPFLLEYFSERSIQIVHLVRHNLLQTAISVLIANRRQVWQNYDGSTLQGRFRISPKELFTYLNWIKEERAAFGRLSQDLSVQTCVYEDLIEDLSRVDDAGYFREDSAALSPLANFLSISNRFRYNQLIHKVINRPYAEILENYNELVRAVKDSEFAMFADTI
jgi:LPS sulfotransferase NodH